MHEKDSKKVDITKQNERDLSKASGGSLRKVDGGFEVFDSTNNKSYGVFKDWGKACKVAKEHKLSAMGTWGDDEVPLGLVGSGFNRKDVREKEDRDHEANSIYGTGSFEE